MGMGTSARQQARVAVQVAAPRMVVSEHPTPTPVSGGITAASGPSSEVMAVSLA